MNSDLFRCIVVSKDGTGEVGRSLDSRSSEDLPAGELRIRVHFSSVNYKDALAATGHPGVTRNFPHVPGIDAVGEVIESSVNTWSVGEYVVVTGHEMGMNHWGGWAEQIRVPSAWALPLPPGLTCYEAMALGTAGFTAAQCVSALIDHQVTPESGQVLVTGATGGVGSMAIRLLANLGYDIVAATGKPEQHEQLQTWGASEIVSREQVHDDSGKPLLKARWAGSVDTVGGGILATTLRSVKHRGCVAACGLTAGHELPMTVYPFLLRGVNLAGIDSAACPAEPRKEIWRKLANEWKLSNLVEDSTVVSLADLDGVVDAILAGKLVGRTVIKLP